ncbi:hypothetical protein HK28_12915 [Acetobacter sp. DsW_063]|nr:hypothetical protein HK28_12915 [Acetobacter sp. DsW_063]
MPTIRPWDTAQLRRALEPLDHAGFAQEWLRRNDDYRHDYDMTVRHGGGDLDTLIAMARRWGADFPM